MSDFSKHAERAEAKRAGRVAALDAVSFLPLELQRDALFDALVEVEAATKSGATYGTPTAPLKGKAPASAKSNAEPDDTGDAGITDLIKSTLRGAKGRGMTAPEIAQAVGARSPEIDGQQVLRALTRLNHAKSRPLQRHGRAGSFRYSLRGNAAPAKSAPPSKAAPTDTTLVDRIMTALLAAPTKDYGALAEKLLGGAGGENNVKIRNTIYYLHREKKLKKRPDGTWEAA